MAVKIVELLLLLQLLQVLLGSVSGTSIRALDGFGRPVAWWAVLKLPSHVKGVETHVIPTPCDCPVPDCGNVPTNGWPALETRATGLCYLYADSQEPTFQYFRDLGFDCLGQGGNDPVSHTLKQREAGSRPYWALFNDQLNGIAGAFPAAKDVDLEIGREPQVCGGADVFSAHAKGAVVFQKDGTGGVFLQTSTPNFPDPTRNDSFVRLGCQVDNNVAFAQHLLALSLEERELVELGENLQLARLCSGNFFRNVSSLHQLLGSANLYEDGVKLGNNSAAAFYHALLDPQLPVQDAMKAEFRLKLSGKTEAEPRETSRVFEPLSEDQGLMDLVDEEEILVLVKSPRAAVPPWTLVAELLDSDVSVASWWDGSYGIPTICGGDVFTHSPNSFCLDDPRTGVKLNADGSAPYNIENLMEATYVPAPCVLTWL
uniref:Uncharacterized protein n=1 Tax=Hyaloperonospora arabidopsidis (strain Emoy2) TaxID=559515 RepID=M4B227_HYAAE